jgi:sensor histidine kinase YesM
MLSALKKYNPLRIKVYVDANEDNIIFKRKFRFINALHTYFIIPLAGIVLPVSTGLLHITESSLALLLFDFSFFIAVALIIYKGNMFFLMNYRVQYRYNTLPYGKMIAVHFLVNIVYSAAVSLAFLSTWNRIVNNEAPFDKYVMTTTLGVLVCVLFINNAYEMLFLNTENIISKEKTLELERSKTRAELCMLTSQVDPHFMYNALNTLSYIIQKQPQQAERYNVMLANMYRYVLQHHQSHTVLLSEELEFCSLYFSLQQLRFGNSVSLDITQECEHLYKMRVPPLSVQTLLENAYKHNMFTDEKPLRIKIHITSRKIAVSNNLQKKIPDHYCLGTGLSNLRKRIALLMNEQMEVAQSAKQFSVKLPVLHM